MTHINQRRDSAANWAFLNPVLMEGEVGWEEDTRRSKLGNGVSHWNDLLYTVSDPTVTAAEIGLGNVDNTHDIDKPVSSAAQAEIDYLQSQVNTKAPLASPVFTGDPKAPTPAPGDNDTSLATTAFVKAAIDAAVTATLLAAHPVGSYYTSETATSPATLFGGTWTRVKGKFIVGVDEADTTDLDWDVVGKTGGGKTHSHTIADHTHAMKSHTHYVDHTHGTSGVSYPTGVGYASGSAGQATARAAYDGHTHGVTTMNGRTNTDGPSDNTTNGAGVLSTSAPKALPPFVAAYVWKRTA